VSALAIDIDWFVDTARERLRRVQRGIVEALDVTTIGGHNVTVRSFVRLEDCYADDEASEP